MEPEIHNVASMDGVPNPSAQSAPERIEPATNGRSSLPRPISSTHAETGSADTMQARIGRRPTAARSWGL